MKDKQSKKITLTIISIALVLITVVGVTYSFFNYTRTGLANTISVGRIAFNSSQDGRVNLSNIFPIDPTETGIMDDTTKVGTVAITVTGDTTYDKGVEYLVSAVNVNNTVGTKTIPISINAEASGTLGTSDDNYFDDRDTATSHIYEVLAKDTISNNDQLMVGYIAKGATGVNGTITIKAYIDKDKIAISDTYDGSEDDNHGTTVNWVNGRTVFTTTEWNSLQTNGISFQVKVEANEGTWVEEQLSRNDMKTFTSEITNVKSSITEVNFIKASEDEINTHANLIDLTADGGHGMVKAWIENNKLYVASPGETYFPESSSGLFTAFDNLKSINFSNINTNHVTRMDGMFSGDRTLTSVNLSSFNTSNVTNMSAMFQSCSSLSNLTLGSNFTTTDVMNMSAMFLNCTSLITIDLSSFDTKNVTDMAVMFSNDSLLETIYVSNNWSVGSETGSYNMFTGCTSLKGGGTPQTTYDANHVDKEYARIDGGANSSTPGYLTLKTN